MLRNAQIDILDKWMRDFMKVASVALDESPQQSEAPNKVVL
ncbi:hypothetical protein OKW21_001048 [Catalinimonas alkaloidigena]|nr:hypothetical protein [Catalinimonas alkaloidigena]MDF9795785.1 hypothetical protein [Catalinimonas alkaloidigena]